ncbi:MAG: putative DNA binding domain-containing protein [Proteobacteria bacterium]|nr:putative DNA binding domain-containing protein [Pseudomonadota bacterium]MBU4470686.1 putative DNA binding domain-containing protein [Pseudomonadota bacterium]MCG2751218.1 putative DNA binding domain-containing protein [Desulfobacteraceae bacterium]
MKYRKTTDEELALMLEEGEGYHLEFKANVNTDLPKELVALANASGGRILIGVNDHNQIVGSDLSNKAMAQIEDMAAACDSPVSIQIEKVPKHRLVVIHVPESANRPHRCNKGFYLRNGTASQKMSTATITTFLQSEGRVRFDEQLRMDLDWQQALDPDRLNHFLNLSKIKQPTDIPSALFNLGAGSYKNGEFHLNQAGVLFFSKEPTLRLFHVSVVCALFKGTGKAYILDRKELAGSLLENVEDALLFLKKHLQLRWEITSDSTRRKEILELPEVALREAVINAVCHRDYLEQGAQVMVEIFDDRVEIYNPGGLPKGFPVKEFGKLSICRNPLIAGLLLRCNYIEKMGTGIERIRAAVARQNCPPVEFRFNTMFGLVFPRPTYTKEEVTDGQISGTAQKGSEKTSEKTSEKKRLKTSEKILNLVAENPHFTIAELSETIGVTTRSIERNIKNLQQLGRLLRIGPDKGGHWEIIES